MLHLQHGAISINDVKKIDGAFGVLRARYLRCARCRALGEAEAMTYLLPFAGEITRPYSEARPRRSNMR
jgi:hypothetical protein